MATDVWVCRKCKNADCLVDLVDHHRGITCHLVKCQKICHGPVVGVEVDGRMEWFERVDGVKQIGGLLRVAHRPTRSVIPKALAKRRVKKRAGRPPRR
jgi:hypothetical protein